jgi:Protein of unknown function (DUF1565)
MQPNSILRNRIVLHAALLAIVLMLAQSLAGQVATTYYVSTSGNDSNAGTMAAPWLTISHAANVATAGATVYVFGGVYTESVNFPNSGTSGSPITFQSYPGQTAVIDGTGVSVTGIQGLINIVNQSYITVSGFEIRNYTTSSASLSPCGVWITGSGTGVRILNNLVHNITTSSEKSGNAYGISAYGTSQTPITQLVISGNEVYNLKTGNSESVNVDGNVTYFQMTNNIVHDNDNIGIDAIGDEGVGPTGYDVASYGIISGNTVYNISGIKNTGEGSSYDADGIYCDGCAYVTIENNWVYNVDYGIEVSSENQVCQTNGTEWTGPNNTGTAAIGKSPCYAMDVTVRNNVISNSNACGYSIGGYAKASANGGHDQGGGSTFDAVFVNNTLYNNAKESGPTGETQIQNQVGSGQDNYFENNLIYAGTYNTWIYSFAATSATYPAPPATNNYDLYYSVAGYVKGTSIEWADVKNYNNFAAFQSTTGEDVNSLNVNPAFESLASTPANFDVTAASPAVNAGGTSLSCSIGWCDPNGSSPSSIYGATDFLGNPRMTSGAINIGAYQVTGIASNTLTVNLTSGTSTLQPGQSTILTATVSAIPGGGGAPSGTVNFMLGSTLLSTQTLLPTGVTTTSASLPLSASQLANGGNTLTAVYSGNTIATNCCTSANPPGGGTQVAIYPGATSSPITVTVAGSPGIYSPANNASLTGNSASFQWGAYPSATAYWLDVGKEQGGNEYYSSGSLSSSTASQNVSSLPSDGSTVWARWYYLLSGTWQSIDYSYTAFGGGASKGAITSPAPNSAFGSSSVTFSWTAGSGASAYWIDAGSTAGGHDYYSSGNLGNVLTENVIGLPTNGSTVYVTLYSLVSGSWLSNGYTYTAYSLAAAGGVLTTPNPGSTLTDSTVTFNWSAGSGSSAYWVDVGSATGGHDYYSSGNLGGALITTVSGLPTDGSTVYVTLYSLVGSTWSGNAYSYTALNATGGLATIQTPTPNTTLSGSAAAFTWSADANATAYWMDIGTGPNGNTIYSSGNLGAALTTSVYSLPADGSTIYVTLYSYVGGQWLSTSASYLSGP